MSASVRPVTRVASLIVALALTAGGCRDSDEAAAPPLPRSSESSSSTAAAPKPVRTKVTVGTVTGHLAKKERLRVAAAAGHVVDRWFEAAYVGDDYPRRRFANAFAGFTPGARAQAHADRALLTNQDIGRRIDAATAKRRRVQVDVLAVRGRAAGLTARFTLDLATTGKVARKVWVRGRLFLTRTERGWQVFGYDVSKGGRR
jgi:hypothetical protein